MSHHNLRTVVSFELRRTITQKRFWIATMIVPLIIAVVCGLVYVSNSSTSRSLADPKPASFTIAYTDASGLVLNSVVRKFSGGRARSVNQGVTDVKQSRLDAFFAFPADPTRQAVRVYGSDVGIFNNGKYATVAFEILQFSADAQIA